jgi:hypothetical protein
LNANRTLSVMLCRCTVIVFALACSSGQAETTLLDVTDATGGALQTGTAVIGGEFCVCQDYTQPTGTGGLDPFLRIEHQGAQQGYNTDARPLPLDDRKNDPWTRSLRLISIPVVQIDHSYYREFTLDANQSGARPISLNQVQIFQSGADVGLNYTMIEQADTTHVAVIGFAGLSPVFQINNTQNIPGTLDGNIEIELGSGKGSGSGDMYLYVPCSQFDNSQPDSYITLFAQLGQPSGRFAANDGYEEWSVRLGVPMPAESPEPSSLVLLGMGVIGLLSCTWHRCRRVRQSC